MEVISFTAVPSSRAQQSSGSGVKPVCRFSTLAAAGCSLTGFHRFSNYLLIMKLRRISDEELNLKTLLLIVLPADIKRKVNVAFMAPQISPKHLAALT